MGVVTPPLPEDYQPPLGWRSHLWRYAAAAGLSALTWENTVRSQWQDHRALFWVDLLLGLAVFVLVYFRRRWPVPVALVAVATLPVSALAVGPATLAMVSLATRRRMLPLVVVGIGCTLALFTYAQTQDAYHPETSPLSTFITDLVWSAAILSWGMFIGSKRELVHTLRGRAERAEREQELRAEGARTTERARIAREMHDVLAHRISRVSMQAGAMAFRGDLSADELRRQASVIQDQANAALTDLRSVLGVLREHEVAPEHDRPQPTYADLGRLLDEARESGMKVEFQDLSAPGMPDVVGRTIYRIVQEGLTNARKHAPGAVVRVELSGNAEDGVDVLLRNALAFSTVPAAPGSGLGLVGLAERAALRGGRLEHRQDGSTFVLRGWIPWAA